LVGFSEVALGFLGFSSVVLVLGWRSGAWSQLDRARMVGLFVSSTGALFLSLVALAIASAGVPALALWRGCSALMLAYGTVAIGVARTQVGRLSAEDRARFNSRPGLAIQALSLVNLVAQALNVFGFSPVPAFTVFYSGLIWFLVFSTYTLGRALFAR